MSETQITPAKNFEERISDKIRETFAELVRQDELDAIVRKVIQDALFKERIEVVRDTWSSGYSTNKQKPSLVEECLEKFMRPEIAKCVDQWLSNNPTKVFDIIETTVKKGVASCVFDEIDRRFGQNQQSLLHEIQQVRNALGQRGIPIS